MAQNIVSQWAFQGVILSNIREHKQRPIDEVVSVPIATKEQATTLIRQTAEDFAKRHRLKHTGKPVELEIETEKIGHDISISTEFFPCAFRKGDTSAQYLTNARFGGYLYMPHIQEDSGAAAMVLGLEFRRDARLKFSEVHPFLDNIKATSSQTLDTMVFDTLRKKFDVAPLIPNENELISAEMMYDVKRILELDLTASGLRIPFGSPSAEQLRAIRISDGYASTATSQEHATVKIAEGKPLEFNIPRENAAMRPMFEYLRKRSQAASLAVDNSAWMRLDRDSKPLLPANEPYVGHVLGIWSNGMRETPTLVRDNVPCIRLDGISDVNAERIASMVRPQLLEAIQVNTPFKKEEVS
jgi:hypothetical protein